MKICIYGASSNAIDKAFIDAGEKLGAEIAQRGQTVVFGGGAAGLMGAVARGAEAAGGEIIGICPSFFNVDGVLFQNCTEMIYTKTMSERKTLLEDMSDAFIVTPGGIGTFDEFFETITLRQLCIHTKPIAILNTNGYFDPMITMLQSAVDKGFMPKENMNLFFASDSSTEILNFLESYRPTDADINTFKNITK